MNTEYILKADVLDIIFDHRNKTYGAYELRKFYHQRLYKAMGVTLAFVMVVSGFTFLPDSKHSYVAVIPVDSVRLVSVALDKEKPLEPKQPEPPKTEQPKPHDIQPTPVKTENFSHVVITKDEFKVEKIHDLDSAAISNETNRDPNASGKLLVGIPPTSKPGDGGGDIGKTTPGIDYETPRLSADIMPEFPGGLTALRKFLQKNLQNPQDLNEGENISVKVKFIVGYDGKLKGFETIQDGGKAFNNEVIRVLKKMPEWNPGKANGQNVSVYYVIPVQFRAAE